MAFRCPKCRGGDFTVTEEVLVTDWMHVEAGRVVGRGRGEVVGSQGFYGDCKCGHHWSLRRKTGQDAAEEAMDL